jgi:hypothetical protein
VDLIWVVPVIVLLVGAVAIVALLRETMGSAKDLGSEIARFGELHVRLARVRTDIVRGADTLRDLRKD